jgi:hypothetical protein
MRQKKTGKCDLDVRGIWGPSPRIRNKLALAPPPQTGSRLLHFMLVGPLCERKMAGLEGSVSSMPQEPTPGAEGSTWGVERA